MVTPLRADPNRFRFNGFTPIRKGLFISLLLLTILPTLAAVLFSMLGVGYPFPVDNDSASWRSLFRPLIDLGVMGLLITTAAQLMRNQAVLFQLLNNQRVIINTQLDVTEAYDGLEVSVSEVKQRINSLETWMQHYEERRAANEPVPPFVPLITTPPPSVLNPRTNDVVAAS